MLSTNRDMMFSREQGCIENMNNNTTGINNPNTNINNDQNTAVQQEVEDNRTFREKHPECYGTYSLGFPRFNGVWYCEFDCDTKVVEGCVGIYIFYIFLCILAWFVYIYVCFALFVIKFYCFLFSLCCGWEFYWGRSNVNVNQNTNVVNVNTKAEANNTNNINNNIQNKTDVHIDMKPIVELLKHRSQPEIITYPQQYPYMSKPSDNIPLQGYASNMGQHPTQGMIQPQIMHMGSNGSINTPTMGNYGPVQAMPSSQMINPNITNISPTTQPVEYNQLPTKEQINTQNNLIPPTTTAPPGAAGMPSDTYLEPVEQQQVNPELYISKPEN